MITLSARYRKSFSHSGALLLLLLVGTLLALSLLLAKMANRAGIPGLSFLMLGLLGAGGILLSITVPGKSGTRWNRQVLVYAFVAGTLFALPNAMAFLALPHLGAGFVSLSFVFPLLLTWLMALFMGMEIWQAGRLAGVLLGLCGGAILALGKASASQVSPIWLAVVAIIPVIVVTGNIYRTRCWPTDAAPLFLAALMMLGGAMILLPLSLLAGPAPIAAIFDSADGLLMVAAEAAIFALLYFLYFVLQRMAGAVYLSQIGIVAAPIAITLSVIVFDEPIPPHLLMAGVLILLGVLMFQYARAGR
ncbi:DMT family transporter [Kushneria sp. AK178]